MRVSRHLSVMQVVIGYTSPADGSFLWDQDRGHQTFVISAHERSLTGITGREAWRACQN